MNKILLLNNDNLLSKVMKSRAKGYPVEIYSCPTLEKGKELIKKGIFDAIVVAIPLTYEPCPKRILQALQQVNPYLPVFFS